MQCIHGLCMNRSPLKDRTRRATGTAHPIDVYVGARLKLRRTEMGLSQTQLAERMGITFQQVQKYERGVNRISASRLFEAAKILKTSVDAFFTNMPAEIISEAPPSSNLGQPGFAEGSPFSRTQVLRLINNYYRIEPEASRLAVADFVEALTPSAKSSAKAKS